MYNGANGPEGGAFRRPIDNYDWLREQRRKHAATTAGTNVSPTPQSNPNTICGRLIDASVKVGGFGGLPIASGGVGIAALGGSAYAAPTYTGLTASTTANPLSTDLLVTLTLNNVPQDNAANQLLWVYRLHGSATWTPWAEQPLAGLPNPPVAQTVSFGFAQLQSGQSYDIGIAYTGLNGQLGAIATVENNYVMPTVAVPSNYLLGTITTPVIASATASTGASSNGISSPLTLNWTCTNQPTDGSLSRLTVYVRQASTSTWAPYASIAAVGVSSSAPPAIASYAFTFADLTNGLTYDFGASYENAQGGEGSTTAIVTGIALASVSTKGAAMPAGIKTAGPTVSTSSVGTWLASGTANPVLPATFTISDWASGSAPSWLLGERLYVRQHAVSTSAQPFMDVTPGQNVTTQIQVGLNAATTIDLGVSYLDVANNESSVTWPPGLSNVIVPAIGTNAGQTSPATISSTGPTITAVTISPRNRRVGMTQNLFGTLTLGDWGTTTGKPNWVQAIMAYSRVDGTTTIVDQVQIDPNAPTTQTASTSTFNWMLPASTGDSVDIGFAYEDVAGHLTATAWPAALNAIGDPDGSVWDGGGKGLHTRMSQATQNTVLTAGGIDFSSALHTNKDQDNIADGATYARTRANQLIGGAIARGSVGKNVIPNPSFELNDVGTPINTLVANGAPITNGWFVHDEGGSTNFYPFLDTSVVHGGSQDLAIKTVGGYTVAANTTIECRIFSATFPVRAQETYFVSGWVAANSSFGALPTGTQVKARIGLWVTDAANSATNELVPTDVIFTAGSGGAWQQLSGTFTIPTTVATGKNSAFANVQLAGFLQNTTGSAITISTAGNEFDIHFDDITCTLQTSLDTDVFDGATYARVKGSELASGTVKQLNDGTNVRTAAHVAGAIDTSSRVIGSLYDGTTTLTPANVTSVVTPAGTVDVSKPKAGVTLPRTAHDTSLTNAIDAASNSLASEFPGGKYNLNDELTNVDGQSSRTTYTLAAGQPFTACADIALAATSTSGNIVLGNQTNNGYGLCWDSAGHFYIAKWIGAAFTVLTSTISVTQNTNYHTYRLTVTPGQVAVSPPAAMNSGWTYQTPSSGTWSETSTVATYTGTGVFPSNAYAQALLTGLPVGASLTFSMLINATNGACLLQIKDSTMATTLGSTTVAKGTNTTISVTATVPANGQVNLSFAVNDTVANGTTCTFQSPVVSYASNVIEASLDGNYLTVTDTGLTLTTGTWPVTLYTGGNAGKVQHYSASAAPLHIGKAIANATTFMNAKGAALLNMAGTPQYSYSCSGPTAMTVTLPNATYTRTDLSTVAVATANLAKTGLVASTTYYWNLAYDAPTNTYVIVFYGTTAPTVTQMQTDCFSDGRVNIYAKLALTTPASGTGGGTGGGGGSGGNSCPAYYQPIVTLEHGIIRADEIDIGMHIPNGDDWVRVTEVTRCAAPLWRYTLRDENGVEESWDVNDTHVCKDERGEWLRVRDMKPGDILRGVSGPLTVADAYYLCDGHYIAMEVEGHEYTLGDALVHNPNTL